MKFLAAALAAFPAFAQAAPVKVYYRFSTDFRQPLPDQALKAAISNPDFELEKAIAPDVLVLSLDGPMSHDKERTRFGFTLVFTRDGDKIGESNEDCGAVTLADCTDQIASDIKSAAGMGH